jgi:hypothetical protein
VKLVSPKQCHAALALALLALTALMTAPRTAGAQVVPPKSPIHGYTLTDMASELALFDTSGNDLSYLPTLPFQTIYLDPSTVNVTNLSDGGQLITAGNSFTVPHGTEFFVPIYYADDSAPVIGNWPTDAHSAVAYFFGRKQLGFTEGSVTIDNQLPKSIGEGYLAGPVQVPSLLDGAGTHVLQIGFFMVALRPGQHTLVLQGRLAGSAFQAATGLTYQAFQGTYTVTVTGH